MGTETVLKFFSGILLIYFVLRLKKQSAQILDMLTLRRFHAWGVGFAFVLDMVGKKVQLLTNVIWHFSF